MSIFPKVPEPKLPSKPLEAIKNALDGQAERTPRGQQSLVSAGKLQRKAKTVKSSLLGSAGPGA